MKYGFKEVVLDSRTGLNPRKNFVLGNGNNNYITIKDISEESSIPFSTLNTFLYGNSKDIKLSTAVKLAKALNVSIDELKSNVSSRRYSFSRSKKDVTKLFQTYLDICGNYALYCKAVDGYTQICMESFFGDGCELC